MEEQTLLSMPGETTQMVGGVECPVCRAANTAFSEWCVECGFRLDSAPGEDIRVEQPWSLAGEGQVFALKTGENVVGRLNADVFLSDASVSRRHATVIVDESGVRVRDEGSSNGTYLGTRRLEGDEEAAAPVGTVLRFGSVSLRLRGPGGEEGPAEDIDEAEEPGFQPATESTAEAAPTVASLTDGMNRYPLRAGENTIGRRSGNDVVLPDPYVSGRHAVVSLDGGLATLTDTGSTNGTFVNGERLAPGAPVEIDPDTPVRFGQIEVRLEWVMEEPEPEERGDVTDPLEEGY